MADFTKVLRGMTILDVYRPDGERWELDAQHDEIFCEGPHPSELSADHAKQMLDEGWTWSEQECWHRFT